MILNKKIIEEEKKKLTSKDIKIITNFNKEKRDIHSYFRSIYFDGKIDFNLNELDGTLAHELTHIKDYHLIKLILAGLLIFAFILIVAIIILQFINTKLNTFCTVAIILLVIIVSEGVSYLTLSR